MLSIAPLENCALILVHDPIEELTDFLLERLALVYRRDVVVGSAYGIRSGGGRAGGDGDYREPTRVTGVRGRGHLPQCYPSVLALRLDRLAHEAPSLRSPTISVALQQKARGLDGLAADDAPRPRNSDIAAQPRESSGWPFQNGRATGLRSSAAMLGGV